jgi:hypothetical protein
MVGTTRSRVSVFMQRFGKLNLIEISEEHPSSSRKTTSLRIWHRLPGPAACPLCASDVYFDECAMLHIAESTIGVS